MNDSFTAAMRRAMQSTRAFDLGAATREIQNALSGRTATDVRPSPAPDITPPPHTKRSAPFTVDPAADVIEPRSGAAAEQPTKHAGHRSSTNRVRKSLAETLKILREGQISRGATGLHGSAQSPAPEIPQGAQFVERSFSCAAGTRAYKLYVPASAQGSPRGLVVMLHGCKQNPDDFATGTGMNAIAETRGLVVAYPHQISSHNASACWNWFRPGDQMRDSGEPAIIAGITRDLMSEFGLDRDQVFAAGLSAGGAMAAILGETYPDLYESVGIHSGLAFGAANDVVSAFSAMRGSGSKSTAGRSPAANGNVRTIVFQGTADTTVHPSNAERIVAAATPPGASAEVLTEKGPSNGGRGYARTVVTAREGKPLVEYWQVEGSGHAWSGGHAAGSFTDPSGPDASQQMVRFFLREPV